MLRVFFSGGYRGPRTGLWQIGVGLAGTVFLLSTTGETLHWDERGFAVPWHTSEILEAVGLDKTLHYTHPDLLNIPKATRLLIPYYAFHVSILPILLLGLIAMHYYLIKVKGISLPFWHKPTGRTAPFSEHVRAWLGYSAVILGVVVLVSIFVDRDPGPAPQLLPSLAVLRFQARPWGAWDRADLPDHVDPWHEPVRGHRVPPGARHLGDDHRHRADDRRPGRDPVRGPRQRRAHQLG